MNNETKEKVALAVGAGVALGGIYCLARHKRAMQQQDPKKPASPARSPAGLEQELLISEEHRRAILDWKRQYGDDLRLYVGVDIGGTNTRVAIGTHGSDPYLLLAKVKASSTRTLINGFETLASQFRDAIGLNVNGACLAGAGRIIEDGETLEVTNYPGAARDKLISRAELPNALFPSGHTYFVNDLESTCYGILALNEQQRLNAYFRSLWPAPDDAAITMKNSNYLVLAVGTGLGIALVLSLGRGEQRRNFQVMPMEFGHVVVSPSGPDSEEYAQETSLIESLSKKLYDGQKAVEYEDIVSGRGLVATYDWVASQSDDAEKGLDAGQIASKAFKSPPCPYAERAVLLHYRYLMRIAKNLCVGLLAKGMFLAGDNQVHNNPFFEEHIDEMRREFMDHPKSAWIKDVEMYTQTRSFNINLHGAIFVAHSF